MKSFAFFKDETNKEIRIFRDDKNEFMLLTAFISDIEIRTEINIYGKTVVKVYDHTIKEVISYLELSREDLSDEDEDRD